MVRRIWGDGGTRFSGRPAAVRDEKGAMTVLFALVLTVILALGSIVVSVGNWYVHKRHLQTQVDAGAFAAGTVFSGCFADPTAANGAIRREALRYAGDMNREPATTNLQVQEPGDVHAVLNSSEYWAEGDAIDDATLSTTHDNTVVVPGDMTPPPGDPSDPCETRLLDVKATDSQVPDVWPWIPFQPSPKAHARIEIRKVKALSGILPFAVPEIDPGAVAVILTNEDAPAGAEVVAATEISQNPDPAGSDLDRFNVYDGLVMGIDITGRDNLSLIVLVSRTDIANPDLSGTSVATICGRTGVRCYAGGGKQDGLALIHGYESGSATLPALHRVDLSGCDGGINLSGPYFTRVGDCAIGVNAEIEFGSIPSPQVRMYRNATCSGGHTTMSNTGGDFWAATTTLPDSSTSTGPVRFSIGWRSGGGPFVCFPGGTVARPYVANGRSGPIQYLSLEAYADGNPAPLPNAYSIPKEASMQPFSFMVTVGLRPPLQQSTLADEPVLIRFATEDDPSLTQSIDCDVDSYTYPAPYDAMPKDSAEIAHGCVTPYAENETLDCSDYSFGDLPPDPISALEDAPDCAQSKNGNVSSLRQGISARWENPCTPNFWPDAPITQAKIDALVENFDTDPRLVTLFVTEFAAFGGTGSTIVPIKYFAGFYVTGWDYQPPQTDGCPENDPHPLYGSAYQTTKPHLDDGDLWGYFVTPVVPAARSSDELCAFDELRTCIAVLVE